MTLKTREHLAMFAVSHVKLDTSCMPLNLKNMLVPISTFD